MIPDASGRLGGTWYTSTPVSGLWEDFLADDLVRHVDAAFRTRADRAHRGIAGQSMGAYGALRLALRRPDRFGAVVAVSPVVVSDPNPLGDFGARAALEVDRTELESASLAARVLWSRARAFSPDPRSPPELARLPYRLVDGEPVREDDVWPLWADQTLEALATRHRGAFDDVDVRVEPQWVQTDVEDKLDTELVGSGS